jgi:transcriptional regulator with XRE-family HTH domain
MEFGERLKAERKRLEMTQQAMADACGVSKRQQLYYEADQWPGGAYLASAAGLGVDVAFVLTGRRGVAGSPEEALLLAAYRNASPEVQRVVMAALGSSAPLPAAKPAGGITIKGGKQAQVIQGDPDMPNLTINVGGKKKR